MDLLVALLIVVVAWFVFKSVVAVLIVLACVAILLWIFRSLNL